MKRWPFFALLFVFSCVAGWLVSRSRDPVGGETAKRQFVSMGTAPVGGAFPVVGGAICDVLNQHKSAIDWKLSPKGTKGSQENIRRLQKGELELGMSNAAISYFAARGEGGWTEEYDVRAIATLAPNVALFVARADSGIQSVADLKGKRVITGPAGAGFQMFIEPILKEHNVAWDEITSLNATQSGSVDQLADGSADAAFLGGAVPTGSITQAASTFEVQYVPFDDDARARLVEKYAFFHPATIPSGTYQGLQDDFQGLNVGSMHLITSASQDTELIYQITKTLWENRTEVAEQHPAGKALNPKNIARDTGIEYHPGAVQFYQEVGVWPEVTDAAEPAESSAEETPSSEPTESESENESESESGDDDATAESDSVTAEPASSDN
ncbi:TAXI family TRAP transporter solute-binding subunit [bacterium]|nr:TAXI family TRAP transporter solute-binding subunit [bacterium]MDB4809778.1 TAXI family TRAP transporter solute-binding subunit [bacterium]